MPIKDNNRKVYPDAKTQPRHKYKFRVEEAKERQDYNDSLTPQQKLDRLDVKLGIGVGAIRQRQRLHALIEAKNTPKLVGTKPQEGIVQSNEQAKNLVKKYIRDHQNDNS